MANKKFVRYAKQLSKNSSKRRDTPQGSIGYDNPRENIDPTPVFKVARSIDYIGQSADITNISGQYIAGGNISGANIISDNIVADNILCNNTISGQNLYSAGSVGIGTTAPSTKLEIAGEGALLKLENTGTNKHFLVVQEVNDDGILSLYDAGEFERVGFRTDGTSFIRGGGLALGSTSALGATLGVTGDVVITGGLTVSGAQLRTNTDGSTELEGYYGSVYMHATSPTVGMENGVFKQISGNELWTPGVCKNVGTTISGQFIIKKAGKYKIDWSLSSSIDSLNEECDFDLFINDVDQDDGDARRKFGGIGDLGNTGATGILDLAVDDVLDLRVRQDTGSDTMTVYDANFNIVRIGN